MQRPNQLRKDTPSFIQADCASIATNPTGSSLCILNKKQKLFSEKKLALWELLEFKANTQRISKCLEFQRNHQSW